MADTREERTRVITEYILEEYIDEEEDEEITPDTPLISSGIVDSFSMVSLKAFIERKYNLQIPDAKATPDAFDSVNNILALLDEMGA